MIVNCGKRVRTGQDYRGLFAICALNNVLDRKGKRLNCTISFTSLLNDVADQNFKFNVSVLVVEPVPNVFIVSVVQDVLVD